MIKLYSEQNVSLMSILIICQVLDILLYACIQFMYLALIYENWAFIYSPYKRKNYLEIAACMNIYLIELKPPLNVDDKLIQSSILGGGGRELI